MNEVLKQIISHIELPVDHLKDQDPEIREIFIEEVQEIVEFLEQTLPEWIAKPSNKEQLIDIRRAFHTLKGSGRMAGAMQSGAVAWSVEELLNRVMAESLELNATVQNLVYSVAILYKELIKDFETVTEHQLELRTWIAAAETIRDGSALPVPLQFTLDYHQTRTIPDDEAPITQDLTEVIDSQTLEIFLEESTEHLQTIAQFLHLQEEPSVENFNQLIRAIHTIRGSSGMVGFDELFVASSNVENVYKVIDQDDFVDQVLQKQLLLDYYEYVQAYTTVLSKGIDLPELPVLNEQFTEIWQLYEKQAGHKTTALQTKGLVAALLDLNIDELLDAEFSFCHDVQQHAASYLDLLTAQAKELIAHTESKQTEALNVIAAYLLNIYGQLIEHKIALSNVQLLEQVQEKHQYLINAFDGLASGQNLVLNQSLHADFEQLVELISHVETENRADPLPIADLVIAEKQADHIDFDPDLLDIFLEESDELVAGMDSDFAVWEHDPQNTQVLKNLFRYLHTLKGGANMVQATYLGNIAHELESIYERVLNGQIQPNTQTIQLIRYAQDDIAVRLQKLRDQKVEEDNPQLIAQLNLIVTGGTLIDTPSQTEYVDQVVVEVEPIVGESIIDAHDITTEESAPIVESMSFVIEQAPANTDFDAELLDIFLEESEELVLGMDQDFNAWEKDLNNTHVLKNLFRYLHTLKGGANMVQATHLGMIAHELESIYERVLQGVIQPTPQDLQVIRFAQDEIAGRLQYLRDQKIDQDHPQLIAQLRQISSAAEYVSPVDSSSILETVLFEEQEQEQEQQNTDLESTLQQLYTEQVPDAAVEVELNTTHAQDFDEELLEIFLEESEELVSGMDADFAVWESDPKNTNVLKNLFRYLHTLKGGANMVQATQLGMIAHELESIYERVLQGVISLSIEDRQKVRYAQDDIAVRLQRLRDQHVDEVNEALLADLRNISQNSYHEVVVDQHGLLALFESTTTVENEILTDESVDDLVISNNIEKDSEVENLPSEDRIDATVDFAVNDESKEEQHSNLPVILAKAIESGDEERIIIVESYFEETDEILAQSDIELEHWKADRTNRSILLNLQRAYHTLKGNSKLIKEELIAVMAYQLELVFEQFAIHQFTSERYDALLKKTQQWLRDAIYHNKFDGAEDLKARLQAMNYEDSIVLSKNAAKDAIDFNIVEQIKFVEGDGSTPPAMYPEDEIKQDQQAQEVIRISADLVEKMIDLSGESAINRSRIELDLGLMTNTLNEMELAIQRLADQLRRMEGELESQIIAKHESEGQRYTDFDLLEMDQYSSLNQLSKSLAESASDLIDFKTTLTDKIRDTEDLLVQQSRLQNELQQSLMGTRLVPFSRLLPRLQRLVRQTSTQLNRPVDFNVENTEGELDRNILERLISPLEHMLRNAIDHGIEDPDSRVQSGKEKKGRINLNIAREGNDILVIFSDDGKGIDVNAVKNKAKQNGLITPDMQVTDLDAMQYIFNSGLTTAQKVTQISGRGVGLDVVQNEIKSLGGHISVTSELGKGTEFTIRVPTSVAVSDALMVRVGDQQFALPLAQIERIVRVSPVALSEYYDSHDEFFELDQTQYRLRYVGEFVTGQAKPVLTNMGSSVPVIIYNSGGRSVALQVDQLVGSRAQIVIKPIGKQLSSVGYVGGATILANGRVSLILDGQSISRRVLTSSRSYQVDQVVQPTEQRISRKTIMVVDDSVTVRKVTSRLLERHGYDVVTAKDGIDAIEKLALAAPDLMLLDIEMPRMDGFEVANYVRHDSHYKQLPIIMITSRTGEKHREHALSLGVNEYMGKPFQESDLIENMTKVFESMKMLSN